jgi:protein TonB
MSDELKKGAPKSLILWTSAGLLVLAAHALAATMLLMPAEPSPLPEPQPVAIMIELAPDSEAMASRDAAMPLPDAARTDEAIDLARLDPAEEGIVIENAQPLPERFGSVVEDANVPIPTRRPEPPKKMAAKAKPKPKDRDQRAMADMPETDPPTMMRLQSEDGDRTAAPRTKPGLMVDSASLERWQAKLMAHLERRKRYPVTARDRGEQGTAQMRFRIDSDGTVLMVDLIQSSGYSALDTEATALIERASPVPAPPSGISGVVTVPVRFSIG